jgi:hypothetical protein
MPIEPSQASCQRRPAVGTSLAHVAGLVAYLAHCETRAKPGEESDPKAAFCGKS